MGGGGRQTERGRERGEWLREERRERRGGRGEKQQERQEVPVECSHLEIDSLEQQWKLSVPDLTLRLTLLGKNRCGS